MYLLPSCLEVIIQILILLLSFFVFLVEDEQIFLHGLFGLIQVMVHDLQLLQILLTIYQFVESVLEGILSLFGAFFFLFKKILFGFL